MTLYSKIHYTKDIIQSLRKWNLSIAKTFYGPGKRYSIKLYMPRHKPAYNGILSASLFCPF